MEKSVQLSLALMPAKTKDLFVDQVQFLPHMYTGDKYKYRDKIKGSDEIQKMDSDYCQRVQNQAFNPIEVKEKLHSRVANLKELWEAYFKKNARIFKGKHGTLTFVNTYLEVQWKRAEKETNEMLRYVGESPEALREDIICNPHLHACIKENLLYNLYRILESLKDAV
jgi:hypothetical protein